MSSWYINLPIVGRVSVHVEAENAEDAIQAALIKISVEDIDEFIVCTGHDFDASYFTVITEREDAN